MLNDDELVTSKDSPLQLIQLNFDATFPDKSRLRDAVDKGEVEEVEKILSRPQHPDGSLESSSHAQVTRHERLERTPLYVACLSGHASIASLLLEAFADVNRVCRNSANPVEDDNGYGRLEATTPLGAAVMQGELETCRMLLERGAESNKLCGYERGYEYFHEFRPLAMAVETGRADIARLLWEFDADFIIDELWTTDLVCKRNLEMTRLLLQILGAGSASSLLALALRGFGDGKPRPEIVRLLLEARADSDGHIPEDVYPQGATFLGAAVNSDDVPSARLLLEFGATVDKPFPGGIIWGEITPLQRAISASRLGQEMVHLLLQHGANANRQLSRSSYVMGEDLSAGCYLEKQ